MGTSIKQARTEILNTLHVYLKKKPDGSYYYPLARQRPIALIGPAGVGKTEIVEQAAREAGVNFVSYSITHHTRQSAIGLPAIKDSVFGGKEMKCTEYTMSEIVGRVYSEVERTGIKEGILFLDEFNCASDTLAPAVLQLLQYKSFGPHRLPDGWVIVLAGNDRKYNKSVRPMDAVTRDRLRVINVVPSVSEWLEYAAKQCVHPIVISYIKQNPNFLYSFNTESEELCIVTPRAWEDLSMMLLAYEDCGYPVCAETIEQYLSDKRICRSFYALYELYTKYTGDAMLRRILCGKATDKDVAEVREYSYDKLYAVASVLGRLCDVKCAEGLDDHAKALEASGFVKNTLEFAEKAFGNNGVRDLIVNSFLSSASVTAVLAETKRADVVAMLCTA
ncbi:MAG: AAA family ATPase [Oscillospiraceae bacterium]